MMSIMTLNKKIVPTNWYLKIKRLGNFNFKQYFLQDENGGRIGVGKIHNLPIQQDKNFTIGLEFEPEAGYGPKSFEKGVYKTEILCDSCEGKQRKKFKFRVRDRNIIAIRLVAVDAKRKKQSQVVSLPIII